MSVMRSWSPSKLLNLWKLREQSFQLTTHFVHRNNMISSLKAMFVLPLTMYEKDITDILEVLHYVAKVLPKVLFYLFVFCKLTQHIKPKSIT